jgi:hypothetical protein
MCSISPPLRLPCVWTGWYEGRAETEDVTAGARVLRKDVQQSSASGNPRADMDMALHFFASIATLRLRLQRMRTSGTKGNAQGRRGGGWESAAAIEGAAVVHSRPAHVLAPETKERAWRGRGGEASATMRRSPLRCCAEQRACGRGVSERGYDATYTHPLFLYLPPSTKTSRGARMNWMENPSRAFMRRTCPEAGYEWEGGGKQSTRSVSADNTPREQYVSGVQNPLRASNVCISILDPSACRSQGGGVVNRGDFIHSSPSSHAHMWTSAQKPAQRGP